MDRINQQWNITEGANVYGSDDHKVGEIVAVHPNYLVVEKGFFFPTDYYIPTSAVADYQDGKVYLSVTKDEALNQGWDTMPAEDSFGATSTAAGYTTPAGGYTADMGATDVTLRQGLTTDATGGVAHQTEGGMAHAQEGDTLRVPVYEEELTATKRPTEVGEVRVDKDVVAEERTLEVPVSEERVRVERRVVDRDVPAGADAFQEGTIRVPVRGETVDVQKRARVAEEVQVTKEAVQRTEQVTDTVRREQVHVDDSSLTDAARATAAGTTTGAGYTDTARGTGESLGEKIRQTGREVKDAFTGDDTAANR